MRARLGTERATVVYVLFGYFANAAYERIRPRGLVTRGLMRLVLGGFEAWFVAWSLSPPDLASKGSGRGQWGASIGLAGCLVGAREGEVAR